MNNTLSTKFHELPFPLMRFVIEYLGKCPKDSKKTFKSIRRHLDNKYCHRCGEYIVAGRHRKNLKHLSCRYYKYIEHRKSVKNYHVRIVTLMDLLYPIQMNTSMPTGLWCPLVFYSKQPKSVFNLGRDDIGIMKWVYKENEMITDLHRNPEFSMIPKMFTELDKDSYNLFDLTTQESRVTFMNRYVINTKNEIFRWMFSLQYHRYGNVGDRIWFALDKVWEYVQENVDMKVRISSIIGFTNVLRFHSEWAKDFLMHYPSMLQYISEKNIKKFYRLNQEWFLNYVDECPEAFKYITLYTEDIEESELIDTK